MFDLAGFERAKFEYRTKRVPVAALAEFFDDGELAEWEVRGLTANEVSRASTAGNTRHSTESIIEAISKSGDQVQAIRNALGMAEETPGEVVKRLEMLVFGSVSPEISMPIAVKLAENFPIEFFAITNAITELTGMGGELVKPEAASLETAS